MEYLLTDEQKMMREMVSKFAKEEIAPYAKENQEKGIYPRDIIE
ncbi:MAG: acyl-CoA dehydrogenase family protein, partial [Chitinispirillia bacterium]